MTIRRTRRPRHIGVRRASNQAERAGVEIAEARAEHGMTRTRASRRAGVAPDTERRVESGDPAVQLDTLCAVAAAVGLDVVIRTYRSRAPSLRDTGQLTLARRLCTEAASGWRAALEVATGDHGEAADVVLFGASEIIAVEIDRLVLDFQDQYRRNAQKRDWLAARHERAVRLVMVIGDTERNRRAVAPHASLIATALPAGSREVLRAVRTGRPLGRDGLLWLRRPPAPREGR